MRLAPPWEDEMGTDADVELVVADKTETTSDTLSEVSPGVRLAAKSLYCKY